MRVCMRDVIWAFERTIGAESLKRNTLRRVGHVEKMGEEFTKRVYMSEAEGPGVRGRPWHWSIGRREWRT